MKEDKIKDLEKLLSENKISEAQEIIKSIIDEKLTSKDRGEALVNIASVYLDIMNSIDEQYAEALKIAVKDLKKLDENISKDTDAEKLREVRESLK
jgi:hypothetical protein